MRACPMLGGVWPWRGAKGVTPLSAKVDVFTSKDFYQDKDLWKDPRGCSTADSPRPAIEAQRGTSGRPGG